MSDMQKSYLDFDLITLSKEALDFDIEVSYELIYKFYCFKYYQHVFGAYFFRISIGLLALPTKNLRGLPQYEPE
jgi:hypothetical protein